MSRSRALHALAADLVAEYPGCRAQAQHDSGARWDFTWIDGPSRDQVRERTEQAAPGAQVHLLRTHSPRAVALTGLRACLAGHVDHRADGSELALQLEPLLAAAELPEQTDDARLDALATALLSRNEHPHLNHQLLAPLAEHGIAPLLRPRQANPDADDALTMTCAEHLTERYARGEDARAWTMRLRTLPAPALVAAARADEKLDRPGRLAVLGLLEDLRRLAQETEADAFAAARDGQAPGGAASWAQIGAALGISRQAAHERGRTRQTGTAVHLPGAAGFLPCGSP